jgi:hypothetical protein
MVYDENGEYMKTVLAECQNRLQAEVRVTL